MEFYEKMNPIDREIMILEAVQGSVALEGMQKAAQECHEEILTLRKELVTSKLVLQKNQ